MILFLQCKVGKAQEKDAGSGRGRQDVCGWECGADAGRVYRALGARSHADLHHCTVITSIIDYRSIGKNTPQAFLHPMFSAPSCLSDLPLQCGVEHSL